MVAPGDRDTNPVQTIHLPAKMPVAAQIRRLDLDVLGQADCIFDIDAKVPDGALERAVPEDQLAAAKVARIKTDHLNPLIHKAPTLARRQMSTAIAAAREDLAALSRSPLLQPVLTACSMTLYFRRCPMLRT
jgi:hypothetical protein